MRAILAVTVSCQNQASLLKNSFYGISTAKFVRKLLNVRLQWMLKFTEITLSVSFSTATDDNAHLMTELARR